jgi:hypothetical protein
MSCEHTLLNRIIQFLKEIPIKVEEQTLPADTFLPGLCLKGQTILIDKAQLKYPGDVLHEAGHIAVTEAHKRPLIGTPHMGTDWPSQGDEIAAILWSYAALHHLQLEPKVVFHPDGYRDASNWFIDHFTNKVYMGLPVLEWMGLCNKKDFPTMKQWLR